KMSSFRKALKSQQRNHHERSQPAFRKNLGLLEKKKDYKLRADDYHKKQNTLAALRKKALDKNPDEFYFKMISSQLQDGVHVTKQDKEEMMTEEQKKVMRTQDIKYVEMKRVAEAKKIERLKGELHLLDADGCYGKQKNKHTFFVDSAKEVPSFDLANHLQTAPELVNRVYNRPTLETLETKSVKGDLNPRSIMKMARIRKHQYKMLSQRIDREKKMFVIAQKIQTRKDLQDKNKKVKVKKETQNAAAIYKFEAKRKR
uniref:U3 small nucleolar RNA-associated protein 11 n=1 Tax=Tetraodon nigroviridis TaxID=99883 RepID=H3CMX4_TETNG